MNAPLPYRLALLAYPARYRAARGPELLATLAEGDEERGRPSAREAAALVYRGLLARAGLAIQGEGLLVAAAALVLLALVGGFTWVERPMPFRGHPAAAVFSGGGPGLWWNTAVGTCAFLAIAVVAFGAADTARARRLTALLSIPLALALFIGPLKVVSVAFSHPADVPDYVWWMAAATWSNLSVTLPTCVAAAVGTYVALTALARVRPGVRPALLGTALVLLTGAVVAISWNRPEIDPNFPRSFTSGYSQSAFADLESGAFIAAAGVLVGIASLWRLWRGAGSTRADGLRR